MYFTGIGFETDPFAGTINSSFSNFDAFSGKDPFGSDMNNTKSPPATTTKTPPPRPAPPKSLKTPVESDPFSGT